MKGSICRVRNTRLGLKMAHPARGQAAIGWVLIRLGRPQPTGRVEHGNVLDLTRAALREEPDAPLYVYLNDDAYRGSRCHTDGLGREQHLVMVNQVAAQLAEEGYNITICEVE